MAEKTNAEVVIGGKVYTLSGYESEEYLQKVAAYINGKLNEFHELDGYYRLTPDMRATLLELNIADDYFKAKAQAEKLEREVELKEEEIYNLKHGLIASQLQSENDKKELERLDAENQELKLSKSQLEAWLEEVLDKEDKEKQLQMETEKDMQKEQTNISKKNIHEEHKAAIEEVHKVDTKAQLLYSKNYNG